MPLKTTDLRILAGKFKGQRLRSPQNQLTHPMGSREKLALFNMIQPYIAGAIALDAYAGSGALGIEALSRGAREVVFVEKMPQIARIIQQNLQQIAVKGHLEAISAVLPPKRPSTADYSEAPQNAKKADFSRIFTKRLSDFAENPAFRGYFSLILADPPYDGFDVVEVAKMAKLLQKDGILALSFPFKAGTPEIPGLTLQKSRKYAAAGIAIYQKNS